MEFVTHYSYKDLVYKIYRVTEVNKNWIGIIMQSPLLECLVRKVKENYMLVHWLYHVLILDFATLNCNLSDSWLLIYVN